MVDALDRLRDIGPERLSSVLQDAGLSGAGGGGFPSYVKWQSLDDVDYLLVNHQESEPNCYVDKWLARTEADRLADLFEALLELTFDVIVVGAKHADRDPWIRPLERATDATVYEPDDLPLDAESESGVVLAYTESSYEYGMENVLLQVATDTVIGKDLPIDYGWIVQNTETVYNIARAVTEGRPVLRKWVHIDGFLGDGRRLNHRMLDVPVGTSAATLIHAAGGEPWSLTDDRVLVEGGPGWCFEVHRPPDRYGVRKRTNCLLVLDEATVADNTYGNDRINVLDSHDWTPDDPATEPTRVAPERVHVPIITNDAYGDLVAASEPVVALGDRVSKGEVVAEPVAPGNGYSVAHHAPVDGVVADVTAREVEISRTD